MKNPPKITLQPASFQTFFPFIILFFLELLENMSYATFFPPFFGGNFCHRNQKIANRIFPMI